jgi:phospholipid/cholesterol/gamma-HCH transport system substrate-binding protein
MEAGKHNWLFKRYFEERGYVEKAPFEVREQAIEESFRQLQEKERALILWEERLKAQAARMDSTGQPAIGGDGISPQTPSPTGSQDQE